MTNNKPAAQAEPLTCVWTEQDDDMPGTYESACGELWSFIDGGPAENNVRFCHGCGKAVSINPNTTMRHGEAWRQL